MNLIRPTVFQKSTHITAVFTEANRHVSSNDNSSQALDFGINTLTPKDQIEKNYEKLLTYLELESNSIAIAKQVHGSNIEIVDTPGIYENTDGLITKTPNLALGIQVADCAAILVADEVNGVIGAFHAGWRGAVGNILPKGLKIMESVGGQLNRYKAYISPCISEEKFEVGEEVAKLFPSAFVDRSSYSKPHVNLKGFLKHQMIDSGMKSSQIEISPGCTIQNKEFFSYRREREKAGRMLGLINLNKN